MRTILFELDPPKLWKIVDRHLRPSEIPVDMLVHYPDAAGFHWFIRRFGGGRAGHPTLDVIEEKDVPSEILAMMVLL